VELAWRPTHAKSDASLDEDSAPKANRDRYRIDASLDRVVAHDDPPLGRLGTNAQGVKSIQNPITGDEDLGDLSQPQQALANSTARSILAI
jgi:hypothetical protein